MRQNIGLSVIVISILFPVAIHWFLGQSGEPLFGAGFLVAVEMMVVPALLGYGLMLRTSKEDVVKRKKILKWLLAIELVMVVVVGLWMWSAVSLLYGLDSIDTSNIMAPGPENTTYR